MTDVFIDGYNTEKLSYSYAKLTTSFWVVKMSNLHGIYSTTLGKKIQFPSEVDQGIIPFEFLGIVKYYNGVDITQTPNYVEMS